MTTVACVFVKGHVPFTADYVRRLASMVRRWMDRPYRFVCLTDRPAQMPDGVDVIAVTPTRGCLAWWTKLELFNPIRELTGRVLYLDLDTVVVGPLAPVLDVPAAFALVPHTGRFEGVGGLQVVKRFNSSVMVFNGGEQASLYANWTPAVAKRLHGDQDWIGEQSYMAYAMPLEWFPRISDVRNGPVSAAAKVVLMKTPKNVEAARRYPWVRSAWA